MESLVDSIIDFIRVRQLNIAVACLFTACYLVFQYWGLLFKSPSSTSLDDCQHSTRLSRSRSRSCSRSRTKSGNYRDYKVMEKHGRRGRRTHKRCPDCSQCKFDELH